LFLGTGIVLTDVVGSWLILAQGEKGPAQGPESFWVMIVPWLPIIVLFFLLIVWPQRREQKKREQMLKALKKNDRVVTIGGIIGTVANISADGKEITLKVDDNTRIKFLRSSISQVLGEEPKDETAAKTT
jgi:preprotein translocase subunit YajC